jgi:group II intron reverse transcriptase/maturase
MVLNVLSRIESLRSRNAKNTGAVNNDLFRLLCSKDLLTISYNKIKSKPVNMTPGTGGETLKGFSEDLINKIIREMKEHSFKFNPVRRKYISKRNTGKTRFLGSSSLRDAVVQQAMLFILEAIYEPIFSENSHGFRPVQSCQTSIKKVRYSWSRVTWIIKGDIIGCYDNIDHHILIHILKLKINDERFLVLIWKLLRAGIVEDGITVQSFVGAPQGGILSPLLANIYLNNLDNFVKKLITETTSVKLRQLNPNYEIIQGKIYRFRTLRENTQVRLIKPSKKKLLKIIKLKKIQKAMLSKDLPKPLSKKVLFTRYEDDWMLGIVGSRSLAVDIKGKIENFLAENLKLTLSREKTKIICASKGKLKYLSYYIKFKGYSRNFSNPSLNRRIVGWQPRIFVPTASIMHRLADQNFCTKLGRAQRKKEWTLYPDNIIVEKYNHILRGIRNYYAPANNFATSMNRIQFIIKYSCAHTLANKHRTRISKQLPRLSELGLDIKRGIKNDIWDFKFKV